MNNMEMIGSNIVSKSKTKTPDHTQTVAKPPSQLRRRVMSGLLLTILASSMLFISHRLEVLTYENYLRDVQLESAMKLIEVREHIETDMFERIVKINELAMTIGANPDMNQTEFNLKAVDFLLANPAVINVAAAPDEVVSYVFPKRGNETVIGLDYRQNAEQWPAIEHALRTGEGIITGPVNLVQGGKAIIVRKPVFAQNDRGANRPWGIVSVVLDYEKFSDRLLLPIIEENFDVLIHDAGDKNGRAGSVMLGDPTIMDRNPITMNFSFPSGNWQLAATSDGGWPLHKPGYGWRWFYRLVVIAAVLAAVAYINKLTETRRRAERQLSIGIEALDHGFVMFDADRRLVAFNRRYKEIAGGSGMVKIGARYEDIVKANLKKGLIPDAVGREKEWYENWSKRLTEKSADKEQIVGDGRLIRAYDRPMEDGSVVGLRIDITDLKKAQIAAEAANKAKTDFMGVLSHELRTPLTVILGHARLAKNLRSMPAHAKLMQAIEAHPEFSAEVKPHLETLFGQLGTMMNALERSGDHLLYLISDILDFAKIDSGTLQMEMKNLSTRDIAEAATQQMAPMVEAKGLELELHAAAHDITGDSKRLQQVLINLIGNAAKFTDKGKIAVKVKECGNYIVFSVEDSGIGIPEDQLSQIFDAFHQVDNTSGRKYGGTGLGLAISRDIARAHGGDLVASSEIGKGSTFTMTLPKQLPMRIVTDTENVIAASKTAKKPEAEAPKRSLVA